MHDRPAPLGTVIRAIKDLRHDLGWAQSELARKAEVTQAWISLVEGGKAPDLSIAEAGRLLSAMGARMVIRVDAPFMSDRRSQVDRVHGRCVAYVAGRLRVGGYLVETEVEVGGDRSRGWIDILAFDPITGHLLVIEIKTEVHDVGAIQRSLGWYAREAWVAAKRFGWTPERSTAALLLLATAANDARVTANREIFAEAFPIRSKAISALIGRTTVAEAGRAVAMIDPRSRRRDWLRPLRVDGRRTPAPYADYADFMRRGGGDPAPGRGASGRRPPGGGAPGSDPAPERGGSGGRAP